MTDRGNHKRSRLRPASGIFSPVRSRVQVRKLKPLAAAAVVVAAALPAAAQGATVSAFLPSNGHTGQAPVALALDDAGNIYTANFYNGGAPGDIAMINSTWYDVRRKEARFKQAGRGGTGRVLLMLLNDYLVYSEK